MKYIKLFEEYVPRRDDEYYYIERYYTNNKYGIMSDSTFFKEDDSLDYSGEFGNNHFKAKISKQANLYKGDDTRSFAKENDLYHKEDSLVKKITGFDTLAEVEHAYDYGDSKANIEFDQNPNLYYTAFQQVAERELKKQGYSGAIWIYEDDLIPYQFQIWDRNIIEFEE